MSSKRILVVEDEGMIAYHMKDVLEKNNYEVPSTVASGEEAIRKAYDENPDIVIMDINLAGEMNGIDAAGRIHRDFGIPVIFLTAYGDDKILEKVKSVNPYGYILKPFNERELVIVIEIAAHRQNIETNIRLRGILSVCAKCSKVRKEDGCWEEMIEYIMEHSEIKFSHVICPDCAESLYGGLFGK